MSIPREVKSKISITIDKSLVQMITPELLKRLEIKNRSQFFEKALLFVLANDLEFSLRVAKEKVNNEELIRAIRNKNGDRVTQLITENPYKLQKS